MRCKKKQTGFTLLELLISIVIVSVIMTIMSGAVRLGLRVWDRGEKGIGETQRIRVIKTLMKQQIASMCTEQILKAGNKPGAVPFIVRGETDYIAFLSNYAVLPDSEAIPVYAKYFIQSEDTDHLVIIEKHVGTLSNEELSELGEEEESFVLIRDVKDFTIKYLKKKNDEIDEWQNSWNQGFQKDVSFPSAIKISFVFDNTPVSFIVNIMSKPLET